MKAVYATVIDIGFLSRALALQSSIAAHSPSATFAFYCLDSATARILHACRLPNVLVFDVVVCESPKLVAVREIRRVNEYCWTLKPFILKHCLDLGYGYEWGVWLDSDMWVYSDIDAVLETHHTANALVTPHRFSSDSFRAIEESVGHFNAGFVAFRNNIEGRRALDWWAERCLDDCPAVPNDRAYADQKYLDGLLALFAGVAPVAHEGVNAAPWNIHGREISMHGGSVAIGDHPLVLFHFQGFKILAPWLFDLYGARLSLPRAARQFIYRPYCTELRNKMRYLKKSAATVPSADRDFRGSHRALNLLRQFRNSRNLRICAY